MLKSRAGLSLGLVTLSGQVDPGLVIIPVIAWEWLTMGTGLAILFIVIMRPVMVIDNVLKPIFMSAGPETPMLVRLVGVLGGMPAYGLVGLFIGPVILWVFYELLVARMNAAAADPAEAQVRDGAS